MTPEERAFCAEIRAEAMKLIGASGLMEQEAKKTGDLKQAWRANRISVGLLALVDKANKRLNRADVATEAQELAAADYDLAALAAAPPSKIED